MYIDEYFFEDKRLLRLLRHLRKLEEWAGRLESPHKKKEKKLFAFISPFSCPIRQWAPFRVVGKGQFEKVTKAGSVLYTKDLLPLYTQRDSEWWEELRLDQKYTISTWLREILTNKRRRMKKEEV